MHPKIGLKIIMMSRQGLTVREIVDRTNLKRDEIINYLIDHGEPVTYNRKQQRRENKITEIRAAMDSMRVLGKPLNCKEVKTMKTGRGIPLSEETRAKVVDLRKAGVTLSQIANELSIGTSSVRRILKANSQTPEQPTAEEKEPAPVAAETSSEWECVTSDTLDINNDNISKDFCQACIRDICTARDSLIELVFGSYEDIYATAKTTAKIAFTVGEATRKLKDVQSRLEEVLFDDGK